MIDNAPKDLSDSQKILLQEISRQIDRLERKIDKKSGLGQIWAWFKASLSNAAETAKKIHIE